MATADGLEKEEAGQKSTVKERPELERCLRKGGEGW